ncbi:hypothetical protein D9615_003991 [Tricholomella constricta]|uniref:SAP domain-containing protein n=1 Tax=Tricholomella constricta TaxID=117010 RepID=A0A8H5HD88_9AGAR|nr:hypothetical protein D9615_003991 [Tricholomella constricta]
MFRAAVPRIPFAVRPVAPRNFVSSVLLTRTWENESVAELRKELKNRGLPQKGNKANLILRIQEYDSDKTLAAIASHDPPVPATIRQMSTPAAVHAGEGVAPGIPPASQRTCATTEAFMNINMPNLWKPVPEFPIQIPYVPDFWDSSVTAVCPEAEEALPKLLVVAGADTHLSGGPSHKLVDENAAVDTDTTSASATQNSKEGGIWDDIADDIGIPRPKTLKSALCRLLSSGS